MNRQRRTSNINNVITYDTLNNVTIPASFTVKGLMTAGFVKSDADGLFSVDTTIYQAALPSQTGNSGKYLTTNGSVLSWGTVDLSAYVPTSRTLTINGTTYDLSANRTWTIPSDNIYNSDGTLTGNRIVNTGSNLLTFTNGSNGLKFGSATISGLPVFYAIYGSNLTPSSTNYTLALDQNGNFTFLNANINLGLQTSGVTRAILTNAGRLLLGTASEDTFLLDVNGTARVSDTFTAGTNTFTTKLNGAFGTIGIQSYGINNAWFGDNIFYNGIGFVRRETGFTGLFYFLGSEGQFRWGSSAAAGTTISNGYSSAGLISFKMNVDGTTAMGDLPLAVGSYTNATFLLFGSSKNIGINTSTDVASAQLHITSSTKGFLPPRMTTTQKNAIATPAQGLMLFDTTLNKLCVYSGTSWETITSI